MKFLVVLSASLALPAFSAAAIDFQVAPGGAKIRPCPNTGRPERGTLDGNAILPFSCLAIGEPFQGNNQWFKLDDSAYAHGNYVKQIGPGTLPGCPPDNLC